MPLYSSGKFLLKHAIFAGIFTLISAIFIYVIIIKNAEANRIQDKHFLELVMIQLDEHLALTEKTHLLLDSKRFNYLKITNSKHVLIYEYLDPKAQFLPFDQNTHLFYAQNLKVEYHHNDNELINFFYQLLLCVFLCAWASLVLYYAVIKVNTSLQKSKKSDTSEGNLQVETAINVKTSTIAPCNPQLDELTELKKRNAFVEYFTQAIDTQQTSNFHFMAITRCSELQSINQHQGFNEGDNYVSHVANLIKAAIEPFNQEGLFRLNSTDFACLLPNIDEATAKEFTNELTKNFNKYQQSTDIDSVAYTGSILFSQATPLGELLALADTSIGMAQTLSVNACHYIKESDGTNNKIHDNRNWRQEIDNVIENQRISLMCQTIKPNGKHTRIYHEVLARFINIQGESLPTISFFNMAEKLDKIVAIDKMIIEKTMQSIQDFNLMKQSFGININHRTINDEYFMIWLERRLLKEPEIASALIFEISESGLQQNITTAKRFVDMLHRTGARITVERFGIGLTSFKFFKELQPDFIKMDSTYTRDIEEDKNNQYFLRLMIDLAHRLSIKVLAESVENKNELFTLNNLLIDGCQGFYMGKPQEIKGLCLSH